MRMPNPVDPAHLSPAERLAEVAEILAAGLMSASKPSITIVGAGRKGTAYAQMAERMVLCAAGRLDG